LTFLGRANDPQLGHGGPRWAHQARSLDDGTRARCCSRSAHFLPLCSLLAWSPSRRPQLAPKWGIYSGREIVNGPGKDDRSPVELGVRFTVSTSGSIVALRFYKTSRNVGKHTGSLRSSSGARLARVTFTNDTASGWQIARLSKPVEIVAGRYVASYHTDTGHYAQLEGAFASGATLGNSTMRATAGIYRYGSSGYPRRNWRNSAYFVDALFVPSSSTSPRPPRPWLPPPLQLRRSLRLPRASPTSTASTSLPPASTTSPTSTASISPTPTNLPTSQSTAPQLAQCSQEGAFVWSNLESCGWAGPNNTGYQLAACPNGLSQNVGSTNWIIRVTTANTRIDCQNIVGCLSIEAPNVTVSNIKIACSSRRTGEAANGTAVIYIDSGASATIDRAEINGMSGVHSCIWHQGTSMMVRAINCYKVNDGIFSWSNTSYSQSTGDNFTITGSYFHDFTTKTANGHVDGYQTEGAGNGLIRHNTYLMTSDADNEATSAIAIWNSQRSSHDITVQDNLIAAEDSPSTRRTTVPPRRAQQVVSASPTSPSPTMFSAIICSVASATTASGFHAAGQQTDGNARGTFC
jgi:hypothetical protein